LLLVKYLNAKKQLRSSAGGLHKQHIGVGIPLDPAANYFRRTNQYDLSFEAKKRKIFKALY
jgi:hypothetical protein